MGENLSSKILVTGCAGFIGSHVTEALLRRGNAVIGLDNFDDYYDPEIKHRNVAHIEGTAADSGASFELQHGDIRDYDVVEQIAATGDVRAMIHLAARAGVRPSIEQAHLYSDVNLSGSVQLFEAAQRHGIKTIVFASSSSVYGERKEVPFRETDRVDGPVSPYAATKKAGELLAATYHHLYGFDISCLRFFTVYGPRQRPEMAIAKFTRAIDNDEVVSMYARGEGRRDFTYIGDIVTGILAALDKHRGYGIYNLGNHRMVTVRELIQKIGAALGKTPRVEELPEQPGDVSTTCASVDLSREKLGYEPSTSLEAGLAKYVEWYQGEKTRTA